jgi:hypothetical protein
LGRKAGFLWRRKRALFALNVVAMMCVLHYMEIIRFSRFVTTADTSITLGVVVIVKLGGFPSKMLNKYLV